MADGLEIDLNAVPKKYDGLDGTELAISESQERMAVVVAAEDVARFKELAYAENLEATVVAKVTEKPYLVMHWNGKKSISILHPMHPSLLQRKSLRTSKRAIWHWRRI